LAPSNLPGPEKSESFPVPAEDRFRFYQDEGGPPIHPRARQPDPEEASGVGEFRPFDGALQHTELVAEGQNLHLPGGTTAEARKQSGEKRK
jgi:hypothetical protein